jgi:nitroreductase
MNTIALPKPDFGRDMTVQSALEKRKTVREISEKKLSAQTLSNLLWSARGVNRKKGPFGVPGITAGSASNAQEIDLYVALEEGVYLYDPAHHRLALVVVGDFRVFALGEAQGKTGARAPARLIYVVDIDKFSKAGFQEPGLNTPETQKAYYYIDTGLIAGNVYLFAASQGLAAWFHNCNKAELSKILKLRNDQHVLFGQTVGYPEKK